MLAEPTPTADALPPSDISLPPIADDLFCQHCGYNLRTLTGEKCPECGTTLAGVRATVSQIPWVHRKEIGRVRAYWKTVWMVLFRRKRLAEEMARPVSFSDAQKFRWVTIAAAYLPVLLWNLILWIPRTTCPTDNPIVNFFWTSPAWAATLHLGAIVFLVAVTGVPSYFFHPRALPVKQQNRAIAMSYYACAPIVFLPLPVCISASAVLVEIASPDFVAVTLLTVATLLLAVFAQWWVNLIFLARRTISQCPRRAVWVTLCVPPLWGLLGLFAFVGIPGVIFYVWLVFRSLA